MKKVFFTLAAVAALTFTLASCKKDRTCTCTDDSGGTSKSEYKKVTKKTVRDEFDCVSYTEKDADGIVTYSQTCDID